MEEQKNTKDSENLRKAQMRMFDILNAVDEICKKHDIPYWIGYGTLLGAVRHGGFIPWDDDLDISLMRKDYLKLLPILKKELPENFELQAPGEPYYDLGFAKVRDKKSKVSEKIGRDKPYLKRGIYIDVFHLEPAYPALKKIARFFYDKPYRHIRRRRPFKSFPYFLKYLLYLLFWPIGVFFIAVSKLCAFIGRPKTLVHGHVTSDSVAQKKTDIFPLTEVVFEGKKFPAPGNYDRYLRRLYGNYMELPPKEKRHTHFGGDITFYD